MAKTISMYGDGYADICIYLAELLAGLGEKVLIKDSVALRKIDYCMAVPEDIDVTQQIFRFKHCDYTQMEECGSGAYTVVVNLYGTVAAEDSADLDIYAMAETSEGYARMRNNSYPYANTAVLIIKDSIGAAKKSFSQFARKNKIKDVIELKFDKKDIVARAALEFTQTIKIGHTSSAMQKLLLALCREIIPKFNEKEYRKAVHAAEKGANR